MHRYHGDDICPAAVASRRGYQAPRACFHRNAYRGAPLKCDFSQLSGLGALFAIGETDPDRGVRDWQS
ncbi:hypothetical protein A5773_01900 [Mycobacterium sp. 852014-52450_SCH5900713]|nr:hypothetical protein A5773_01900 [Mycobacterium sp. 852014-52450_SCH5900713]